MKGLVRQVFIRPRGGFNLLDVALATVVMTTGVLFMGLYFRNVYDTLSPKGSLGGIRRYMMAEQMLKAQAEGLRLLETISTDEGANRLVSPPNGLGFTLNVTQSKMPSTQINEEMYYFDLSMSHSGTTIAAISMSTLRRLTGDTNVKIGL